MKRNLLLTLPLAAFTAHAGLNLPAGVYDLSRNGGISTQSISGDVPPPCTELKPVRYSRGDAEIGRAIITKNGDNYDYKYEPVCRIQSQVPVYRFETPADGKSCFFVRSAALECETMENGKPRKISTSAIVLHTNRPFFTDEPASEKKSFHSALWTSVREDESTEFQETVSSSFLTPDLMLPVGQFDLRPSTGFCMVVDGGKRTCNLRPLTYGSKLSIEDRP